jgi:DNA-binding XRE family transcriptional regulator
MTSSKQATRHRCFPAAEILKMWSPETLAPVIAEILGVNKSSIFRWETEKTMLDVWQADKYAVRLGLHPSQIWTDWYDKQ